mmetsp:Transcript_63690/g.113728  ORF Transcript_63690/g.113728 Transcript_63690/m.113728 type:complete len:215 (+) Transcript_63690:863-1507(+)
MISQVMLMLATAYGYHECGFCGLLPSWMAASTKAFWFSLSHRSSMSPSSPPPRKSVAGSVPCHPICFHCSDTRASSGRSGKVFAHNCCSIFSCSASPLSYRVFCSLSSTRTALAALKTCATHFLVLSCCCESVMPSDWMSVSATSFGCVGVPGRNRALYSDFCLTTAWNLAVISREWDPLTTDLTVSRIAQTTTRYRVAPAARIIRYPTPVRIV